MTSIAPLPRRLLLLRHPRRRRKRSTTSTSLALYLTRKSTANPSSRLRGKIDSNGCVSAFLEERLNMGLQFILSAEIDHKKKDYKFGFGLRVGQ